mgnify:CR=1 FL=1
MSLTPQLTYSYRGQLAGSTSILLNATRSEIIRGLASYVPGVDLIYEENWLSGDDTTIANDYAVTAASTGTATISTNPGYLTVVTAATLNDTMLFSSNYKDAFRAKMPRIASEITLSQLTDTLFEFRFYDDSDEYVALRYDSSVSANWYLSTYDGTTNTSVDTGVAATTSAVQLVIEVETDGTAHVFIDGDEVDVAYTSSGVAMSKMTADGHYRQFYLKALAAAAKTVKVRDLLTTMVR